MSAYSVSKTYRSCAFAACASDRIIPAVDTVLAVSVCAALVRIILSAA